MHCLIRKVNFFSPCISNFIPFRGFTKLRIQMKLEQEMNLVPGQLLRNKEIKLTAPLPAQELTCPNKDCHKKYDGLFLNRIPKSNLIGSTIATISRTVFSVIQTLIKLNTFNNNILQYDSQLPNRKESMDYRCYYKNYFKLVVFQYSKLVRASSKWTIASVRRLTACPTWQYQRHCTQIFAFYLFLNKVKQGLKKLDG